MSTVGESRVAIQTTTDGLYLPLEGQRDIRLLEVLPGDDASTVVTTMITVSLDNEPTYAALSYAWGDATQRSIIECNGKSISITTSLAEALKAFRSFSAGPDAPLKKFQEIWADQLCINQHDVLERNHQVGIMSSVYSSSACAFIWLGPGDEHSDQALRFIDSLEDMIPEHAVRLDDLNKIDWNYLSDMLDDAMLTSDGQAWAGLVALFSRPWFNRSWTFQEPIRAPGRMIACGSKIWNWNFLLYAALVCRYATSKYPHGKRVNALALLTIQEAMQKGSEDLHLSALIYTSRKREASDPRDKVYALYGLVQDNQRVPLEISYAMSVEDVYRSTVRFCIENEGKLSILGHVARSKTQSDLPSWVPDWRDQSRSGCRPVDEPWTRDPFNASSMSRPLLVPSSSNDKLILKGFTLAIVERTIQMAAFRVDRADSSPDSWRTDAAAAGVPRRFLQGKRFQTCYGLTTIIEKSPLLSPDSTRWLAAGSPEPIPQAVLTEYKKLFDHRTRKRCLFLTKDSLGLAPAPTQVGDRVCILLGGNAPFILRPRQNTARSTPSKGAKSKRQSAPKTTSQGITKSRHQGSRRSARVLNQELEATEWTLLGDCYLYGYMRGEAMETVTEDDYVNFTLV